MQPRELRLRLLPGWRCRGRRLSIAAERLTAAAQSGAAGRRTAGRSGRGEIEGKGNRTINLELRILINVLKEENLWKRALKENYKPLPEAESDVDLALTVEQLTKLEGTARTNDRWFVAYHAEILAANSRMRDREIRKTTLGAVDLENRRIHIRRKATKTNKGARIVELNAPALAAVTRLYQRAQQLRAASPDHYLLPADLSRHVKDSDPLKDRHGFDVTRHQQGWLTSWHNLRKKAGLEGVRFHDLRHTFITVWRKATSPCLWYARWWAI